MKDMTTTSYTPRTDAALQNTGDHRSGTSAIYVVADFARTLECELNDREAECKRLRKLDNDSREEMIRLAKEAAGYFVMEAKHALDRLGSGWINDLEERERIHQRAESLRARLETAKQLLSELVHDGKALDRSDCNHANLAVRWQAAEQFIAQLNAPATAPVA